MKKLIKFFITAIAMFLILSGCGERGPVGPEGPRGPQGPAGPEVIPTSFEFEADLLQSNGFEFFQDIPAEIEVFESDVMLAYVFEDYIEEDDLEVWRQLPLTEFNSNGTVLLDFDFTFVDLRFFQQANYNLGAADEYRGLLIRAVHVPAGFLNQQKTMQLNSAKTFSDLEAMLGFKVKDIGNQ
ncbi:collagen-like protein [Rhodohalobacter halophilus]|uniref:collagen-like protein n=1 Tax=Rhodohalobacter halophilus TaxID=1812810 RepID=UPI00083F8F4D|nr:collagen-like protein [Rhodohalobacter halophilus]